MQITISESEIHTAITMYVKSQGLTPTPQMTIDLRATRGPEGYTAVIDTQGNPEAAANAANLQATQPVAEQIAHDPEPQEESQELTEEPATEEAEQIEETEAPAPAPTQVAKKSSLFGDKKAADTSSGSASKSASQGSTKPSIFAGMTKPVNAKTEDTSADSEQEAAEA